MGLPQNACLVARDQFGALASGILSAAGIWANFASEAERDRFIEWASGFPDVQARPSRLHADTFRAYTFEGDGRDASNPTPHVSGKYGAPMGRDNRDGGFAVIAGAPPFRLFRVRLDRGGYDSGGAYWGLGAPLYYFEGPLSDISGFVRGSTRERAKEQVRAIHPNARFYR